MGKGKLDLLTQNTSSPGPRNLIILQSSVFEFSQEFSQETPLAHHARDQQNQLAIAQFLQMEKILYICIVPWAIKEHFLCMLIKRQNLHSSHNKIASIREY